MRRIFPQMEPPALPGVTHEWVDAGGLRTHVALAGPEDGPVYLLVHGWPQHWWMWRDVIPALATGHRVVCPDLRGHGWTDAPRDGYEKEQLASDLLALLDALGIERARWVGHDWGGWTGTLAALRAPERVESLLALGIPHPWSRRADPRRIVTVLGYQGPISLPFVGPLVSRGIPSQLMRRSRGRGAFTDAEVATYADVIEARPHVTVAMYRTFLTREVPRLAAGRYAKARLEMPARFVVGSRDPVARMPAGPVPGQPNATVELVRGLGHWIPEEDPELVVERALSAG